MKGVLLFAFNNEKIDYYEMAIATAKRANHFLDLPVSVVTDISTKVNNYDYKFDKTFIVESNKSNKKNKHVWINKGRYQAYELSPYDETLLIDTDYLINSDMLNRLSDFYEDFMCPNKTKFLLNENIGQEFMSTTSFPTLWATVIAFKKTLLSKQLFDCIKAVQENYLHYINLYNIMTGLYRNDYALTIAHRIINGHYENKTNYIPWSLTHIADNINVVKNTDREFNTEYTMVKEDTKARNQYIIVKDTDFHCMNKQTFMEIA